MNENVEQDFVQALYCPGMQICVDNQRCNGEISNLLFCVKDCSMSSILVELTPTTTWNDLCKIVFKENFIRGLTEHDVMRELHRQKKILIVNNFENADKEISVRIADLAKLMTEIGTNGKVIIIGAGDTYYRLMRLNSALRCRVRQVILN